FTCFGSANEGLPLNPRNAFFYQTTPDSFAFTATPRFRLQRFGVRNIPEKRLRYLSQPESQVETICTHYRRPNAGVFGTQCGYDAATVSHHRGAWTLLSEGVLSQRLHQEPEATRPLLQHTRRKGICVRRHFRTLLGRNDRKSQLLAQARSAEQHRHDNW